MLLMMSQHVGVTLSEYPEEELVMTPALALMIFQFHFVRHLAVCCRDLPQTGNKESSGCMRVHCPSHLNVSDCPRVGEPAATGLRVADKDLCCSGTMAMDKVSTRESLTASHCPQHTISASVLQLCNFLFSSVLTCIHEKSKIFLI